MSQSTANRPPLQAGDDLTADQAYRHLTQGGTILWTGDFHNGRQLLLAVARRIDRPKGRKNKQAPAPNPPISADDRRQAFHAYRQQQAQRAALLNRILVPVTPEGQVSLRRAPDTCQAITAATLTTADPTDGHPQEGLRHLPLRAVLGMLGAWEWQRKGVNVAGLDHPVHVRWGVFSPLRGEYLDLLWKASLSEGGTACDVGTGSGVLSLILAKRGMSRITATDTNPAALLCAQDNVQRHGFGSRIHIERANLFPDNQQFDLIVCNPPWLPAKPTSAIEQALYDPDHAMLKGFLQGARKHLKPGGEVWLIMSDLAEHLGLRAPGQIEALIAAGGLQAIRRYTARPQHGKADATNDPLHFARNAEVTSLWQLRAT